MHVLTSKGSTKVKLSVLRGQTPETTKVGFCYDFINGKCTRGDSCPYKHVSRATVEKVLYPEKGKSKGDKGGGKGKKGKKGKGDLPAPRGRVVPRASFFHLFSSVEFDDEAVGPSIDEEAFHSMDGCPPPT